MNGFIGSRALPAMTYYRPETLDEAMNLVRNRPGDHMILAGGTDIIPKIRMGMMPVHGPLTVIDIARIKEITAVGMEGGFIRIGAAARLSDLARDPVTASGAPMLVEAVLELGSSQVRNTGTIGGNLCTASPAADTAPPLLVMDAQAVIRGGPGERVVPLEKFFTGPGETVLGPGDILTGVRFAPLGSDERWYRVKLGRRNAFCISIISLAVRLAVEDGCFKRVRIALGAVAPTPIRAHEAEAYLTGREISPEAIDRGARLAAGQTSPISDVRARADYRLDMARVLTRRGILSCVFGNGKGAGDEPEDASNGI